MRLMPSLPPKAWNRLSSACAGIALPMRAASAQASVRFFIGASLKSDLQRGVETMLVVLDDDVAEIDIGQGQRHILVQEIGRENVPGRIFLGDQKIVGFGAIFSAD